MSTHLNTEWWRPLPATSPSPPGPGGAAESPAAVRETRLPFGALMAFLFVLLVAPQSFVPALAPLRLALLAAVIGVLSHLATRFAHGRPLTVVTREMVLAGCLVGWALLTLPLSYWPGGSVSLLTDLYFKALAMFWLLANTVSTRSRLRVVLWGLTLMAVPMALMGIKNWLSGAFLPGAVITRIKGYESALTQNPNDLALTLNLILPLALALVAGEGRKRFRLALLGVVALIAAAVVFTFSRAGFVTLMVTAVVYLVRLVRARKAGWAALVLLVALVVVTLLPPAYVERLSTITDTDSDPTGSSQARKRDTKAALYYVATHPLLGAGVGMNILALNEQRGAAWTAVHNAYLEYAVDLGVPGALLFLAILFCCFRSARAAQKEAGGATAELAPLAQGIWTSLLAFSVAALFHPIAYHFYFYLVAGLAVAVRLVHAAERRPAWPRP